MSSEMRAGMRFVMAVASAVLAWGVSMSDAPAGDEDYLRAITAEGERLETLGKARQEEQALQKRIERQRRESAASAEPGRPNGQEDRRRAASPRAQFEQTLRQEFPFSYALYVHLSEKEKDEVYGEYRQSEVQSAGRFLPVLRKIVQFSTAKNPRR